MAGELMEMKCVICFKHIADSWDDVADGAIVWISSGNYGSTIMDCDPLEYHLAICDECALGRGELIAAYKRPQRVVTRLELVGDLKNNLVYKTRPDSLPDPEPLEE